MKIAQADRVVRARAGTRGEQLGAGVQKGGGRLGQRPSCPARRPAQVCEQKAHPFRKGRGLRRGRRGRGHAGDERRGRGHTGRGREGGERGAGSAPEPWGACAARGAAGQDRGAERRPVLSRTGATCSPRRAPPLRTNRTRRVLLSVLIGHDAGHTRARALHLCYARPLHPHQNPRSARQPCQGPRGRCAGGTLTGAARSAVRRGHLGGTRSRGAQTSPAARR